MKLDQIPFNIPFVAKNQLNSLSEVINNKKFSGDGFFTNKCSDLLQKIYKSKVLLTTSCTHALEMSALLCNISPGDEVIMPSFTFVSTANAFVNFGAKVIFVDIDKSTMNIDPVNIENAITKKTKAIVAVHYSGYTSNIEKIAKIAKKNNIFLIEDAAQAIGSYFKGKSLGTFGDFGCLSFHETKNIQCGEGGALIVNNESYYLKAEVIREKGTNRSQFFRGEVDKYRWISKGSSYLPSEFNAAFLYDQLKNIKLVTIKRNRLWDRYYKNLINLKNIKLPTYKKGALHNGHIFFIKVKNIYERSKLIDFLKKNGIQSVFHYIPLHESIKCKNYYSFKGLDKFTTIESQKLLRLPMFFDLSFRDVDFISEKIIDFYS